MMDIQVLVIDNLSSGSSEFVNSNAQFIEMDIRDSNLSSIICEFKLEYIFYEAYGLNYICYRYSNVYGPR